MTEVHAALCARLDDERDELKDCSRLRGQQSALDPVTAQRIANTMFDAIEAIEALSESVRALDIGYAIVKAGEAEAVAALFSLKREVLQCALPLLDCIRNQCAMDREGVSAFRALEALALRLSSAPSEANSNQGEPTS